MSNPTDSVAPVLSIWEPQGSPDNNCAKYKTSEERRAGVRGSEVNLYRRHRPDCEAERPWQSRSSEYDKRRKDCGRKCACQIHGSAMSFAYGISIGVRTIRALWRLEDGNGRRPTS
jgi:hypothetical protein